ncbi:hypothetical protein ACS0TY_008496 [Phlomoides rotata]
MDRRGEDHRDIVGGRGIPTNYNHTPQESPHHNHVIVKLPLAPIVSPHQDRRGLLYAPVSTRRGSSIFSPTQTLDHHHHRRLLNPPPPPPDPDPPSPATDDAASNSKIPSSPPPTTLPPPPPPTPTSTVRYKECLKNHAASMGGHVVDGCGEFMPSGEDGTAEALRCAACDCHRNFHRKEVEGGDAPINYNINRSSLIGQNPPPMAAHQHHKAFAAGLPPPAMVNFGGGDESSSEDLNAYQSTSGGGHAATGPSSKKRFRTKFSQHQKEKMQEAAEKIGWRIQKQDEEVVQRLCSETGVKRQVFKVWMHNNKQAMKKRHQISD